MCGIVGCLALVPETSPDHRWIASATERISHRGPDDEGFYADPDVALGFKRLAIIDLSPGGHQPLRSADGRYWMVFNGEIYNYVELGAELRDQGVTLRSTSDSEVLLETYARVGKDVVHRLRGMYAFAIWDTWERELFCARDPFGIKPFYYRLDSDASGPPWEPAVPIAVAEPPAWQPPAWQPPAAPGWQGPAGDGAAPPATSPPPPREPAGRGSRGRHAAPRRPGPRDERRDSDGAPGPAREAGAEPASGAPGPVTGSRQANGAAGPLTGTRQASGSAQLLRFASERKALAAPGELRTLDPTALSQYLSFQYVPAPATLTPPVRVLPPGHALTASPGRGVATYRFWRPELRPRGAAQPATAASILTAMRDSVAVHLRSDAPLGAFLSGGIDSAAICALAAEHRPDLLTFTVGFEREGYSEVDRAQETAAALKVRNVPYLISPEEFFTHLPRIIWHLDDPMADAAAVPLWFVAREASKQVKVVLSGEGSDELFGGYAIYHQPGVVRAGERLPEWGRAPIQAAAALIPTGVKGKGLLERTSTPLRRRYIGNAHVFAPDELGRVAAGGVASPFAVTDPVYDQAEADRLDDVSTMQLVDINTWLAGDILVKADRMTMAHSLELRVPFLDTQVMAVAAGLARDEKIGAGTTKLALREAMAAVLPKAAAERAKLGFPVPVGHWLRGEAHEFAGRLLREAQTGEWVNRQAALDLLARYRKGEPGVTWRHLWVLIVFSLWHQVFVENAYDTLALGWERPAGVAG